MIIEMIINYQLWKCRHHKLFFKSRWTRQISTDCTVVQMSVHKPVPDGIKCIRVVVQGSV